MGYNKKIKFLEAFLKMPTSDDEIPRFSTPKSFKASKRASRITRIESATHREAAIRRRFSLDERDLGYQINPMEIYENIESGKFPTNDQVCIALQRFYAMISKQSVGKTASTKSQEKMLNNLQQFIESLENVSILLVNKSFWEARIQMQKYKRFFIIYDWLQNLFQRLMQD